MIEALLTAAGLPLDGVQAHLPGFVLAFRGEQGAGVAGIERHGVHGLLRSVAVRADQRGQGTGQALTSEMIRRAREAGLERLVLLTTTADGFYSRFGFSCLAREDLPPCVFASPGLQGACPASAVVMQLTLNAGVSR
ncbi:arsenic resistance N-acetyltransferase ArsN2 [Deinococcus taeanensis]|uniref:arsenic resistance N-acetyltransferase ArsN2 n=1 Tax=Deinococcus taeanensis TaxID=2737050 RepID=UPI002107602F|nr:arsenic resistance N-acetyltransferase ArsN2 [Deinococcus taeanensis]